MSNRASTLTVDQMERICGLNGKWIRIGWERLGVIFDKATDTITMTEAILWIEQDYSRSPHKDILIADVVAQAK